MKTGQKQKVRGIFMLRTKKSSKYQTPLVLLFVALFVSARVQAKVVVNEIMVGDKGYPYNEFVELYNSSETAENIENYQLVKRPSNGVTDYYLASSLKQFSPMPSHTYVVVAHPSFWETIKAEMPYSNKSNSISPDNIIVLYDKDKKVLDAVSLGNAKNMEGSSVINPENGKSVGRIDGIDTDDNSNDFSMQNSTPGKENEKPKTVEPKTYPRNITITELFPNPFKYIELYNGTEKDIDLSGWVLHDASKAGKYTFPENVFIEAKKYLALFKNNFKFALNNSGLERVALIDPNGEEVSFVEYSGSKRNVSYNFNGIDWHWSKFLTPGKENIFNNEPNGTVKIDDDVFVNVYADFSVSTGDLDGDTVKVTWDFGDGHKSYISKTRHKYLQTGKYEGSVKLSDGSEDVVKNFSVEVEDFPHPKVKIIKISANPEGVDKEKEFLTIENKSKNKINLKGWSIATGWKKKFINHPIRKDFIIKKNKAKEITSDVSSFTLNNTKAKIQLRYPDGKVAQEVKYKSPNKTISEDEKYVKVKSGWAWVVSATSQKSIKSIKSIKQEDANSLSSVISQQSSNTEENKIEEIIVPDEVERENKLVAVDNENVKIELLKTEPRVLGTERMREIDGVYFFTPQIEQQHYAIVFLKDISSNFNSKINMLLNYFLK